MSRQDVRDGLVFAVSLAVALASLWALGRLA